MYLNSLRKHEILRKKQVISELFRCRKSLKSDNIKIVYSFLDSGGKHPESSAAAVLFAVSKKSVPKAVMRNRVKRLMKEAYRLEKTVLLQKKELPDAIRENRTLCLAVIYIGGNRKLPAFALFRKEMSRLLRTLSSG
ncbi:MAG: ribonuclease P protein component [Chlorobium limicola]|uniref:Ribonuclease P protein component n=1 Tax=Chlorobium limicola (strain DSM 245 / NBRC 103803 / 6330) TaxID=290315 RepID=B3EIM9_CHLL2|nr:ribonuclease P protein component [Chlorobium limicola]ACD91541.1 ribonuclease P [Chlorobium limicola DSM 245]NTV08025.1 ribonuclease P protein component [Chlorobium limicola]NTV20488.1 ribonuclease P protein component [Chlorobium limicola]